MNSRRSLDDNKDRKRKREKRREREGRTAIHGGDFIRIPFWEISVEQLGIIKRYKKRYQMKCSFKWKSISINVFDVQNIIFIQNMFMNTRTEREEKEREGRTASHVGDFIRIPFWEISVEQRGTFKRYKKRYQKKNSLKGKID